MSELKYHRMKDLPSNHLLGTGTAMCSGCGGLEALHQAYDVMGEKNVFVNAAGCMTLLSVYPFTPFKGSWLYTSMASAPAGAQGVRDALDILKNQGRMAESDDLNVMTLVGDGSANGIGMSAISGAIERNLDFLCICYDNEGYGNTGQQYSAATPLGARTATSKTGSGYLRDKKDLFNIWVAHRPAYVATVVGAEPLDLARKIEKSKDIKGPRFILAFSPCPTGWDYDPKETVTIGKLAVKTGIWPLKEYIDGKVVHTKMVGRSGKPSKRVPVEEYLKLQGRFRHLFEPQRNEPVLKEIQRKVDQYWDRVLGPE